MKKLNSLKIVEDFWAAIWAVREDGKLVHNWVERSSWELFQRLNAR
jgi:hypothetical protein